MASKSKFTPPMSDEYHEYYDRYISKIGPAPLAEQLESQPKELKKLLGKLPEGEDSKLHEPYTWTLKQVMGHMIDVERIFGSRMLWIATGDQTHFPGFDQNQYVTALDYESVSMKSLLNEFKHSRKANVELANRLTPESLANVGLASDHPASARACLYILVGHVIHHVEIMKKRLG
jgi:uncharacterized damage-inducible protein DinB